MMCTSPTPKREFCFVHLTSSNSTLENLDYIKNLRFRLFLKYSLEKLLAPLLGAGSKMTPKPQLLKSFPTYFNAFFNSATQEGPWFAGEKSSIAAKMVKYMKVPLRCLAAIFLKRVYNEKPRRVHSRPLKGSFGSFN